MNGLDEGFVREERLASLRAALDWGLPRCHSEASRRLVVSLVMLLAEFHATVAPVEMKPGELPEVSLRVTLSCARAGGARRVRFAVVSTAEERADTDEPDAPARGLTWLRVDAGECLAQPWETAARLVGQMLAQASLTSSSTP